MMLMATLFMVMTVTICAQQQSDIEKVMQKMPNDVIPNIATDELMTLIKQYHADPKNNTVEATLGGNIVIEKLTNNAIKIRTSRLSTSTLMLLPTGNGSSMVMHIMSVEKPIADALLAFYTPTWEPIKGKFFVHPITAEDFVPADVDTQMPEGKDFVQRLNPLHLTYDVDGDKKTMQVTAQISYNKDAEPTIAKWVEEMPTLSYYWHDGLWRRSDVME